MTAHLPPCHSNHLIRHQHTAVCRAGQRGAGMVEFLVVVLPLLMLGLGATEAAHWYGTRQIVSLALMEAARAGSTNHMHPQIMAQAFEDALLPLYKRPSRESSQARVERALQQRRVDLGEPPWQITVRSPTPEAFQDFADPGLVLPKARRHPTINNDYLQEQHQQHAKRGWHKGQGPASGQDIFQANTLALELVWPHRPRLPLIVPILKRLGDPHGSYSEQALANGYLPMARGISMVMQSHPVLWSTTAGNKVILQATHDAVDAPDHSGLEAGTGGGEHKEDGGPTSGNPDHNGTTPGPQNPEPDMPPVRNDPACGVSLCCL